MNLLAAAASAAAVVTSAHAFAGSTNGAWSLGGGPWISDAGAGQAEVRWIAAPGADPGTLVLGTGGTWTRRIVPTTADGIARAEVSGLAADRGFVYRVEADGHATAPTPIRPLPEGAVPVRVVVFGDTRSNADAHARIVAQIAAENPDVVVNTGDLVADGRVEGLWREFFRIEAPLVSRVPLFAAPGNHDERNLDNATIMDRFFPWGPWFERTVGPLRMIFVDSNRTLDAGSAQGRWLRARLDAAVADRRAGRISWIAVMHHHPAYSSAHHGSNPQIDREAVPLYERAGVDVVFTGHDHDYERVERGGVEYFVTGGGGAPLYGFSAPVEGSAVRAGVHHFVRVAADRDSLSVTAIDASGNTIDAWSATRHDAGGAASPARAHPRSAAELPFVAGSLLAAAAIAWPWSGRLTRAGARPGSGSGE